MNDIGTMTTSVATKEVIDMRGKVWFLGGLAAGFVLGTRAGREKYEELVRTARKIKESPTVQEAAGVVQEQANRLYSEGKSKVANSRLAETRLGERLLASPGERTRTTMSDDPLDELAASRPVGMTETRTTSGTSSTGTL